MSSVRSVTLNDVAMPSPDTKTHIVIYHEKSEDALVGLRSEIARLSALVELLNTKVTQLESGAKTTPFFTAEVAPAPCGLDVWRISETPSTPVEAEEIPSKDVLQSTLSGKLVSLNIFYDDLVYTKIAESEKMSIIDLTAGMGGTLVT